MMTMPPTTSDSETMPMSTAKAPWENCLQRFISVSDVNSPKLSVSFGRSPRSTRSATRARSIASSSSAGSVGFTVSSSERRVPNICSDLPEGNQDEVVLRVAEQRALLLVHADDTEVLAADVDQLVDGRAPLEELLGRLRPQVADRAVALHLQPRGQPAHRRFVAAELVVLGRQAADANRLDGLVPVRDVGAVAGLGHHGRDHRVGLADDLASRLVITGLRRNASRSCSSSVMTPTRSTRNVPMPTSLTRASAT